MTDSYHLAVDLCHGRFVPAEYSDELFHRQVYDVMARDILPTKAEDECPPLSMLIYGARNIILPTLLFEQISDLLILLATIDFWRTKLLQKMTTILTWNKIYESDPSEDVRTLSGDQRRSLESHVRPKTVRVLRGMYRALFHRCVHWDIYNAMANEHPVMDMLHMYFPDFITEDEDRRERTKRTYPFHHGLSEEEHTQDREAAIQSLQFVQNVALWRRDPEAYCTAVDKNQESSFANLFPPPLPEEKLRTLLGHYLQQIERMQQVLDDIFGDATSVADDIKQE